MTTKERILLFVYGVVLIMGPVTLVVLGLGTNWLHIALIFIGCVFVGAILALITIIGIWLVKEAITGE